MFLLVSCGGGAAGNEDHLHVALDGSPRVPDAAGVVTAMDDDFATLTLDGDDVHPIDPSVQSFASLDGSTQPLRARLGQYVHVGLDGDTIVWVAGIGSVLRLPDQPETVVYLGAITEVDRPGRRLILRDGTVFAIGDELALDDVPDPSDGPVPAVLHISVATDTVVDVDASS